ncbi:hypothetical protein COO60DRAFT_771567 [Scenedesmus sp. NREL 46B-D3]|nr:hypothetical protein COO60DRAFT_771567 [Scenedesmus sp. NREL 46B-D3]
MQLYDAAIRHGISGTAGGCHVHPVHLAWRNTGGCNGLCVSACPHAAQLSSLFGFGKLAKAWKVWRWKVWRCKRWHDAMACHACTLLYTTALLMLCSAARMYGCCDGCKGLRCHKLSQKPLAYRNPSTRHAGCYMGTPTSCGEQGDLNCCTCTPEKHNGRTTHAAVDAAEIRHFAVSDIT